MYIGEDSSLGVCSAKTYGLESTGHHQWLRFPPLSARRRVGHDYILVLAFGTTRDGADGCPARFGEKMAILSKYMSNFAKIRMDYSCHGIFRGIYVGLGSFGAVILSEIWADRYQKFEHFQFRWSRYSVCKKLEERGNKLSQTCNGRK